LSAASADAVGGEKPVSGDLDRAAEGGWFKMIGSLTTAANRHVLNRETKVWKICFVSIARILSYVSIGVINVTAANTLNTVYGILLPLVAPFRCNDPIPIYIVTDVTQPVRVIG
jgi:hypothetical protein